MNREQAKKALTNGKIVMHTSFEDGEFILMDEGILKDEQGNSLFGFWEYRQGEAFNKGWSTMGHVYSPSKKED